MAAADATLPHGSEPAGAGPLPVEGSTLAGRYRLRGPLGAGSSGTVFTASDLAFDREVAVKILTRGGGEATALFLREARITAQLDHPAIVPVHDLVWLDGGGIAFAMKRIEGMTLREALQRTIAGAPPRCFATVNDVITVFRKICDGLARAHAMGVIHRDIKPDNIVVGLFGEVIILDWGEASSGEAVAGVQPSPVGTPMYMSPEQARGEPATSASDVYTVGSTLFHCLLHRPPIVAAGLEPEAFWERKRRGAIDPPSATEAARHDRRLLAILDKALAADLGRRYATVGALADDLAAYQAGLAVSAYRESWADRLARWHHRHARTLWLSAGLLAAVVILAGVLWGGHVQRLVRWGAPVLSERFDPGWVGRWTRCDGTFAVADGRAVSTGDIEGSLLLDQELPPRSAIEFTGEILAGQPEQDLSVFWVEGDPPKAGQHWSTSGRIWLFQVATWDNTCCVLNERRRGVVAYSPLTLEPGRPHRIRAEVDGVHKRLSIDGRSVFAHEDAFHAAPGRWLLYTCGPGKAFSDVDVWVGGSAALIPVIDAPDLLRSRGLYRDAAQEYGRIAAVHEGLLADRARYKQGLAWSEAGDWPAAVAAWSGIADRGLSEEAGVIALQPLIRKDPHRLAEVIAERWTTSGPAGRKALIRLWITAAQAWAAAALAVDGPLAERMLALRRELFPEAAEADQATLHLALQAGRVRLAEPLMRNPWMHGQALATLGQWQRLLAEGTFGQRTLAAAQLAERTVPPVRQPEPKPLPAWLSLAVAGRLAEARAAAAATAESGPFEFLCGDPRATLATGGYELSLIGCLWLSALGDGVATDAATWEHEALRREANRFLHDDWIPGLLAPLGILAGQGRSDDARTALARLREARQQWSDAPHIWGEALAAAQAPAPAGPLPDIIHAEALLAAMRADLAGDRAAGARLYRVWRDLALPSYGIVPAALMRLACWRAAAAEPGAP